MLGILGGDPDFVQRMVMVRAELAENTALEQRSQERQGANLGAQGCGSSRCKGPGVGAASCVNGTAEKLGWPEEDSLGLRGPCW